MGDDYDFDFKFDSKKVKDWAKENKKSYNSDSGSFEDFLDDSDLDSEVESHTKTLKIRARDGGDSPVFSDEEDFDIPEKPQLHLDIDRRSENDSGSESDRIGPEAKKKLSSSTSGFVQTQHDLETIRWSQDSAVKRAMADAERSEALVSGGVRNSYSSGGALRASTHSWNQNGNTLGGTLKEERDEDEDTHEDRVSSIGSALSTPISSMKSRPPARSTRLHSSEYSDDYDEDYDEDDFVSESPVIKPSSTVKDIKGLDLNKDIADSSHEDDEYSDDCVSEEQDDLNKVTTFSSNKPLLPPAVPPLNNTSLSNTQAISSVSTLVAKLLRLGKRELEAWEEDEENGCVDKGDFVMFFSEYKQTFEIPLKVSSCVRFMKSINRLDYESEEDLGGDLLYNLLYESIYNDSNGRVTPSAVEAFFLKTTASVFGMNCEEVTSERAGTSLSSPSGNRGALRTSITSHESINSPSSAPPAIAHQFDRRAPGSFPTVERNDVTPQVNELNKSNTEDSYSFDASHISRSSTNVEMDGVSETQSKKKSTSDVMLPESKSCPANSKPSEEQRPNITPLQSTQPASQELDFVKTTASPKTSANVEFTRQVAWKEGFLAAQAQGTFSQSLPQPTSLQVQSHPVPQLVKIPAEISDYYKDRSNDTILALCDLSLEQVCDLIWSIGFGPQYAQALCANGVDGSLLSLVEKQEELADVGIDIAIKRKKLLQFLLWFNEKGVAKRLLEAGSRSHKKDIEEKRKVERTKVNNPGVGIGYRSGEAFEFGRPGSTGKSQPVVSGHLKHTSQDTSATYSATANGQSPTTENKPNLSTRATRTTAWEDKETNEASVADPTLPMARVYLKLLAESQQEAAMLKRRVFDLNNEVVQLKAMLNSQRNGAHQDIKEKDNMPPNEADRQPPREIDDTETKQSTQPVESTTHTNFGSEFLNGYNSAKNDLLRTSGNSLNGRYQPLQESRGGSGVYGGEALALQHAARQAQLRKQYDMLRSQLAASRRNAEAFGKFASVGTYTRLTDVQKELDSSGPKPLNMEEALRKVDLVFGKTS